MDPEEQEQSQGPRVVDKRVSSGGHQPQRPATPAPVPHQSEGGSGGEAKLASGPPEMDESGEPIWTPEEEAAARQMAQEIAERPGFDWVVNTAVTLANVAATKLQIGDPADAQICIDALAALVNGVGDRMQDAEAPLRQTLAQLQMAYAQRVAPPPTQGN